MIKNNRILYLINKFWKKLYYGIPNYIKYIISLFMIKKNYNRVMEKINKNKPLNVVFIVQYIPAWNKLKLIYTEMQNDSRYNPIIICVPLDIQNNLGKCEQTKNDTYEYFVKNGYSVINALNNNEWFDLKSIEPDYVFHSRPYNQFMPKCYTSKEIRKYALLCNVLYGASLTVAGQKVTLNKDYFNDVYCYFSFDNSEKSFYEKRFALGCKLNIQKCYPYGATALEQILKEKKEYINNDFIKTVLWTPRWSTGSFMGGSNFFNYVNILIDLAKKNQKVLFIFRQHPLMFDNFIKTGELTAKEVRDFKSYCERESNILLDEEKEYINIFWKSDILVTDASGIIPEYLMTNRPILYCYSQLSAEWTDFASAIINSSYQVHNKEDLIRYIEELLSDKDEKEQERQNCIKVFFGNVKNNSSAILNVLAKS